MTDHPLIPSEIRNYMEKHQIETTLNRALNTVLAELPQDPFSSMAVSLIDSNVVNPTIAHLHAFETFIVDLSQPSVQIDVHLNYQGTTQMYYSYIYTYNPVEADSQNFTWDQPEEKSGMSVACDMINKEVSQQL